MSILLSLFLFVLALLPIQEAFGQSIQAGPLVARRLWSGTTLPSACKKGDVFFDTDATAGSNIYGCTAADTWTLESGGGTSTNQTVFDDGDGITDGVTESKPFALYEDNTDQDGFKIQVHSTRGPEIVAVIGGVDNAADYFRQLNAGKKWGVKDNAGTEIFTLTEATGSGALTNISLDVEATGNSITTVSEIIILFASCLGGSASNGWNDTGTGDTVPTAACNDTGSIQRPSSDFAGGAVNSVEITFPLPIGWTGAVDLAIRYLTDATTPTGNIEWDISTVCRAVGEDWDASFNAAQTIIDAALADEVLNDATQTGLTMTGCAAGEDFTTKVSRDGTNDSNNDSAKGFHAKWTIRRIQ